MSLKITEVHQSTLIVSFRCPVCKSEEATATVRTLALGGVPFCFKCECDMAPTDFVARIYTVEEPKGD